MTRRPVRPNTPLVEQALRRLEAAGVELAPRWGGVEGGHEVVTWIGGDVPADGRGVELAALAGVVRELHDLTGLLHDDLQPRNVVFDGRPEPYDDGADPDDVGRRWRLALDAYGADASLRGALVDTMLARMDRCAADIERNAGAGSERHRVLLERGDVDAIHGARAWVEGNRSTLDAALR